MSEVIYVGNDNAVQVVGLADLDGVYVNAATVTARLQTAAGVDVAGQTWPLTLAYVAASDGLYRGILESALVLTEGAAYRLEISAVSGSSVAAWHVPIRADLRRG